MLTVSLPRARERAGLTQTQLGDAVGYTGAWVSSIETGGMIPRADLLAAIARVLGTSVGALLGEDTTEQDDVLARALPGWRFLGDDDREHLRYLATRLAAARGARAVMLSQIDPDDPEVQIAVEQGLVAPQVPAEVDLGGLSEVQRDILLGIPLSQRSAVAAAFRAEYARQHEGEVGRGRPPRDHLIPRTTRPLLG